MSQMTPEEFKAEVDRRASEVTSVEDFNVFLSWLWNARGIDICVDIKTLKSALDEDGSRISVLLGHCPRAGDRYPFYDRRCGVATAVGGE